MSTHKYFERLSTFALTGQLSPSDLQALSNHLHECVACRSRQAEFQDLARALPLATPRPTLKLSLKYPSLQASDIRSRFLSSARAQGLRFSAESIDDAPGTGVAFRRRSIVSFATLALITILGASLWLQLGVSHNPSANSGAGFKRYIAKIWPARVPPPDHILEAQSALVSLQRRIDKLTQDNRDLENSLHQTGGKMSALQTDADLRQSELRRLNRENDTLRASLMENQRRFETLQRSAVDRERQLEANLSGMANGLAADQAIAHEQEQRLADLTGQLNAQDAALERERQLVSAYNDIRGLIGDRNLEVIDVFDGSKHRKKRPFGRVFYSQGKTLVFYAFDLSDSPTERNSFEAWAQRAGTSDRAKSLGVFYLADSTQGLWVLRTNDPSRLKDIESVFVTDEPSGPRDEPRGKKVLYAYLNQKGRD